MITAPSTPTTDPRLASTPAAGQAKPDRDPQPHRDPHIPRHPSHTNVGPKSNPSDRPGASGPADANMRASQSPPTTSSKPIFFRTLRHAGELLSLQGKLVAGEAQEATRSMVWLVVAGVTAAAVLVASIPVLLLSLAQVLRTYGEMNTAMALLVAGLVGLSLAGIAAAIAAKIGKNLGSQVQNLKSEVHKNIESLMPSK